MPSKFQCSLCWADEEKVHGVPQPNLPPLFKYHQLETTELILDLFLAQQAAPYQLPWLLRATSEQDKKEKGYDRELHLSEGIERKYGNIRTDIRTRTCRI